MTEVRRKKRLAGASSSKGPPWGQPFWRPSFREFYRRKNRREVRGHLRNSAALPPGTIKPEGWLRSHMEGQAKLASVLPDISYPFFSGTFWEGEENSLAWFTWEQKAYWVDGATRLALILGDEKLLSKARASLDYTLNHPSASGFLGPKFLEFGDDMGGLNRWPNAVLNRGYMALADAQPRPDNVDPEKIIAALKKHYLEDKAPLLGAIGTSQTWR